MVSRVDATRWMVKSAGTVPGSRLRPHLIYIPQLIVPNIERKRGPAMIGGIVLFRCSYNGVARQLLD